MLEVTERAVTKMSVSGNTTTFFVIRIGVSCLAFLTHIIGFASIYLSHRRKKINQNIILAYLGVTEVLIAACNFVMVIRKGTQSTWFSATYAICGYMLVFMMFGLTTDRLICAINPLKYKSRVTRFRIQMFVLASCCVATAVGVARLFMHHNGVISMCGTMVSYLIYALITYTIVMIQVRRSGKQAKRSIKETQSRKRLKKQFLVPGLIILSFILFYAVPLPIMATTGFQHVSKRVLLHLLPGVGLAIDPLIYLMLTKSYRDAILQKCTKKRQNTPSQRTIWVSELSRKSISI